MVGSEAGKRAGEGGGNAGIVIAVLTPGAITDKHTLLDICCYVPLRKVLPKHRIHVP